MADKRCVQGDKESRQSVAAYGQSQRYHTFKDENRDKTDGTGIMRTSTLDCVFLLRVNIANSQLIIKN